MLNVLRGTAMVLFLVASIVAGYKFLSINVKNPFAEDLPPEALEPVLTTQTLAPQTDNESAVTWEQDSRNSNAVVPPVQEPRSEPSVRQGRAPSLEEIRLAIAAHLESKGAQILDSKAFKQKASCDNAVRNVVAEYKKRGIGVEDMAETAPFPDSTGLVWVLRNAEKLNYIGCMSPESQQWAVYVQFIPGVKPVTASEQSAAP